MKKIVLITIIFLSFTFIAKFNHRSGKKIAFDGEKVYQITSDRQDNLYAVAG